MVIYDGSRPMCYCNWPGMGMPHDEGCPIRDVERNPLKYASRAITIEQSNHLAERFMKLLLR